MMIIGAHERAGEKAAQVCFKILTSYLTGTRLRLKLSMPCSRYEQGGEHPK
jgi:hypothetical protein